MLSEDETMALYRSEAAFPTGHLCLLRDCFKRDMASEAEREFCLRRIAMIDTVLAERAAAAGYVRPKG
jgi:hypothetical protein